MAEAAPAVYTAAPANLANFDDDQEYRVVFKLKALGLRLKLIYGKILVTNFLREAGTGKLHAAEMGGVIRVGDRVLEVDGVDLDYSTFQEAVAMITSKPRPLEVLFCRGPGAYKGNITHGGKIPPSQTIFERVGGIFHPKPANATATGHTKMRRTDSLRLHKSHLREAMLSAQTHASSHEGLPRGSSAAAAASPLKSCLKRPGATDSPRAVAKKSLKWSDESGRDLEEVWFAERTHYSTSRQKRIGIYNPRMEDPCVVS